MATETPEAAYARLKKLIADLRHERALIPATVYAPAAQAAADHIAAMMVKYNFPAPPIVPGIPTTPPVTPPTTPPLGYPALGANVLIKTDASDRNAFAACMGTVPSDSAWTACSVWDLNKDSKIDLADSIIMSGGIHATVTALLQSTMNVWMIAVKTAQGLTRLVTLADIIKVY